MIPLVALLLAACSAPDEREGVGRVAHSGGAWQADTAIDSGVVDTGNADTGELPTEPERYAYSPDHHDFGSTWIGCRRQVEIVLYAADGWDSSLSDTIFAMTGHTVQPEFSALRVEAATTDYPLHVHPNDDRGQHFYAIHEPTAVAPLAIELASTIEQDSVPHVWRMTIEGQGAVWDPEERGREMDPETDCR